MADETRDWPAIDMVMGHLASDVPGSGIAIAMGDRYRQHISADRIRDVCQHVRTWLAWHSA